MERTVRSTAGAADDEELVAAAQAGDVAAFTTLLRRHDHRMRAVAFGVLGRSGATDDALQEAYLKAFRSIGTYRRDASFTTWLHRIVHNCCIDQVRRRRPLASVDEVAEAADPAPGAADVLPVRDAVVRALQALDPDQRAVVLLVDREGCSYDEVATILGVAPGTVGSRLHRARQQLRRLLEDQR